MSRFPESSIACLKSVMLSCAPEFKFKEVHVTEILKRTKLNAAQIGVWGVNFRMRYPTEKDRMDFLTSDRFDKVTGPHTLVALQESKDFSIPMYFPLFISI